MAGSNVLMLAMFPIPKKERIPKNRHMATCRIQSAVTGAEFSLGRSVVSNGFLKEMELSHRLVVAFK